MAITKDYSIKVLSFLYDLNKEADDDLHEMIDLSFETALVTLGWKRYLPTTAYKLFKQTRGVNKMRSSFLHSVKSSESYSDRVRMELYLNEWSTMVKEHKDLLIEIFLWIENNGSAASAEDYYVAYCYGGEGIA